MKSQDSDIAAFAGIIVFALIWIIIIVPNLTSTGWFTALNPIVQYLLYNVGFILLTTVIFGGIFSYVVEKEIDIIAMVRSGVASWLTFSFIIDMWQPPFYLSSAGQVLITQPSALPMTAIDAMMAYLWGLLGIAGSMLFYFVYIVTPVIAALAIIGLFAPNVIRRVLGIKG